MNVAFDPWIPVVTLEGKPRLASLCEVLTEGHALADLSVRPHERVSLMRLFQCVAHAALNGPKDYDEWQALPDRLPGAARRYLGDWKDSFELFHPTKPWLQIPALVPAKKNDPKAFIATAKLDFALASGSNATLFDHAGSHTERALTEAQLALGLLCIQNFSTCGLLGRPIWNGKATADSAVDAPCIPSSMYHALLVGESLKASICLNIYAYDEVAPLWGQFWNDDAVGRPVWEEMPASADDSRACRTYLGRLVPLSRAICLQPDRQKMLYGEGLRYPVFPEHPRECTASEGVTTGKAKQDRYLVGARMHIRPWRQLDAILLYQKSNSANGASGALSLSHLPDQDVDIWLGALIRNPGKQDILDAQESRLRVPSRLRSPEGCRHYAECVLMASQVERTLDSAIWRYRIALDPPNETGLGASGTSFYWTAVEENLALLTTHIGALGTDAAATTRDAWQSMLWRSAREAYRSACSQGTPRQLKAFTEGWSKLNYVPKEPRHSKRKGVKR